MKQFKIALTLVLLCSLQTFAMDDTDNKQLPEGYGLASCLADSCLVQALYSTGHGALAGTRWDRVSQYTRGKLPNKLTMTKVKDQ
jgi:hypothetical protein